MEPNRHMDIKRVVDNGNPPKPFRTLEIIAVTLAVVLVGTFFYFHPNAPVGGQPVVADIKISSPAAYTEPMTLKSDNKTFSISALGANPAQAVTIGAVTKYVDAFTNTDITETKQSDRIKEDIILKQPGHPATFAYQIDVAPYDVVKDGQGSLVFYQKGHSGDARYWSFEIPAPFMTDAAGKKSTANDVESTLTTSGILTVRPSAAWLAKAAYPVDLDPTIIFFRAGTPSTPTVATIFRTGTPTIFRAAGVVPLAPIIGTATQTGQTTATVSFTAPASNGGATITSYRAIASSGSGSGTLNQAGSGTITVTGLTAGTSYTFTVRATNSAGQGPASAASNSIITVLPPATGPLIKTNQTLCSDVSGSTIACAGTGQDGELQKGVARSYADPGNGTIIDFSTGLTWQKCSDGLSGTNCTTGSAVTVTWANALTYCNTLFLTSGGWRLPNVYELYSIVDFGRTISPIINVTYFPATKTAAALYWSSTSLPNMKAYAIVVEFFGGAMPSSGKAVNNYVRCVKG